MTETRRRKRMVEIKGRERMTETRRRERRAETRRKETMGEIKGRERMVENHGGQKHSRKRKHHSLAYHRDAKRRKKKHSDDNIRDEPYDVESHIQKQDMSKSFKSLRATDRNILKHHHRWLNDRLINVAQQMLKNQYGIPGLQDVTLSNTPLHGHTP